MMNFSTIDVRDHQIGYPVSSKQALSALAQCDDVKLEHVSASFTTIRGTHPTYGRVLFLIGSVGPNIIFGSPGLNLEE